MGLERLGSLSRLRSSLLGTDQGWLLGGVLLVGLVLAVSLPFGFVVAGSLTASRYAVLGEPSLRNWSVLAARTKPVVVNTVLFVGGTAVVTTTLASILAWILANTNVPGRKAYAYALFGAFFFPPVLWEQTWIRLLGRNGVYAHLLGVESLGIHSLPGMVLVQSLRLVPVGILMLIPLFDAVDSSLVEMSRVAGADAYTTVRRVVLPILSPGIKSVFLLVAMISLGSLRVPLVIGLPAKIEVMAVIVFESTRVTPIDYGVAFAEAVLLVLFAAPLLYVYRGSLSRTDQFVTVAGDGHRRGSTGVGTWRYVLSAIVGGLVVFVVVCPIALTVYSSVLQYYVPPLQVLTQGFTAEFTLSAYRHVLTQSSFVEALFNSIVVAGASASIVVGVSLVQSYIVYKTDVPWRTAIDYLAFVPIGAPSVAVALGVGAVFLELVPFGMYGTLVVFLPAFFIKLLPINARLVGSAVVQIDDELLEAGRTTGVPELARLKDVLLPLALPSVRTAWILAFAFVVLEFPITLMLRNPRTELLSAMLYRLQSSGASTETYALGILTMVVLSVSCAVAAWAFGRIDSRTTVRHDNG